VVNNIKHEDSVRKLQRKMLIRSKFSGFAGRGPVNNKLQVRADENNNLIRTSEGRRSNELTDCKFQLCKGSIKYVFITRYIIYIQR
jgi:hypothetical protein